MKRLRFLLSGALVPEVVERLMTTLSDEEIRQLQGVMARVEALEEAARGHQAEIEKINAEAMGLVAALRGEFETLRGTADETRRLAEVALAAAKIDKKNAGASAGRRRASTQSCSTSTFVRAASLRGRQAASAPP